MLRLRHSSRLLRDLASYSVVNRAWWVLPFVVALGVLMAIAVVGQATVPYTMYTMF